LGQPYDFGNYSFAFQPDATWMRLGAALKYAYQQTVDFSVKAVYNRGVFRKGDGNTWLTGHGLDRMKPYGRPGIEVNADLTVRPITPLSNNTSHSTVGLPRESKISRAKISTIALMNILQMRMKKEK